MSLRHENCVTIIISYRLRVKSNRNQSGGLWSDLTANIHLVSLHGRPIYRSYMFMKRTTTKQIIQLQQQRNGV